MKHTTFASNRQQAGRTYSAPSEPRDTSEAIRQVNAQFQEFPAELKARPQFGLWRYEQEPGEDKSQKVPYQPNGKPASTNRPWTWSGFGVVIEALATQKGFDGLGFCFTRKHFVINGKHYVLVGIDLDHCIDENGNIKGWARAILQCFPSYAEFSPSGQGIHLYLFAPAGFKPHRNTLKPYHDGAMELYTTGRYFTVTGQHVPGTPTTIAIFGADFIRWYQETFPPVKHKTSKRGTSQRSQHQTSTAQKQPLTPADEALIKWLQRKYGERFTNLWHGHWQRYHLRSGKTATQSDADMALCGMLAAFTNNDADRIDRLFRHSGLDRPKWDERHYADGQAYGQHTIAVAIDSNQRTSSGCQQQRRAPVFPTMITITGHDLKQKLSPALLSREVNIASRSAGTSWLDIDTFLNQHFADGTAYLIQGLNMRGLTQLEGWLASHHECGILAIEGLATGRRASSIHTEYLMIGILKALADISHMPILLLHHLPKQSGNNDGAASSSTAEQILILGKGDATLSVCGCRVHPQSITLLFDGQQGMWVVAGSTDQYLKTDERTEVLHILCGASQGLSAKDISARVGKPFSATRQLLWRMKQINEVRVVRRGRFTCPHDHQSDGVSPGDDSPALFHHLSAGGLALLRLDAIASVEDMPRKNVTELCLRPYTHGGCGVPRQTKREEHAGNKDVRAAIERNLSRQQENRLYHGEAWYAPKAARTALEQMLNWATRGDKGLIQQFSTAALQEASRTGSIAVGDAQWRFVEYAQVLYFASITNNLHLLGQLKAAIDTQPLATTILLPVIAPSLETRIDGDWADNNGSTQAKYGLNNGTVAVGEQ